MKTAPESPEDVEVVQVETNFLKLNWTNDDRLYYDVTVYQQGHVVQQLMGRRSPLVARSLLPGQRYEFGVVGVGETGVRSEESELVQHATC